MNECVKYTLDGELTGVNRTLGETTILACGNTACGVTLEFMGLGPDNKPILTSELNKCAKS